MPFVCVQPMQTSWARRSEDLTFDKTDEKDAVLIARLTAQLRCYVPEPVDETWGRLRHLGARREELITANVAQIQQIRDLLECVWPAALETAAAAVPVHDLGRGDDGDPGPRRRRPGPHPTAGLGPVRASGATRDHQAGRAEALPADRPQPLRRAGRPGRGARPPPRRAWSGSRWCWRTGTSTSSGWPRPNDRMVAVLDELELTALVTSIHGISAVGAAAILAETGDPHRFATARALVKHAGLAPREKTVRHLHRPDQAHRPRPTTAPGRGLARGLGITADQHRLRRPLPTPDHPRAQQAEPDPGPDRDRRRDPATPARRGHHRPSLGPPHRQPAGPSKTDVTLAA